MSSNEKNTGSYSAFISFLMNTAEELRSGKISLGDVNYTHFADIIQKVYDIKINNGSLYSKLYLSLLAKALEHGDVSEVSDIIKLSATHIMIFERDRCIDELREWTDYSLDEYINRTVINRGNPIFSGRGVVYTAIIGDYDEVIEPDEVETNLDYILFTDNPNIKSEKWRICLVDNPDKLDNVRLARQIKILGHDILKQYDYSVWIDGKVKILGNLHKLISNYSRSSGLLCFPHYVRNCAYQEARACIYRGRDEVSVIEKQMALYREEGFPEHAGMVDTAVLIRDLHDDEVSDLMHEWWSWIVNYSKRDQLSFNYSCWKKKFEYELIPLYIYENEFIRVQGHKV